jgi:hypothetical protein
VTLTIGQGTLVEFVFAPGLTLDETVVEVEEEEIAEEEVVEETVEEVVEDEEENSEESTSQEAVDQVDEQATKEPVTDPYLEFEGDLNLDNFWSPGIIVTDDGRELRIPKA